MRLVSVLAVMTYLAISMMRCSSLASDVVFADGVVGLGAEIARGVFQFQANLLDEFLLQFVKIFFAALENQFAFLRREAVFLVVQADERGVVRGVQQFFQPGGEVGGVQALDDGHAGRLVLQVELELRRQSRKERAVHAAQLVNLLVEIFPVRLLAFLEVHFADVVELVFHAQRAGVGAGTRSAR